MSRLPQSVSSGSAPIHGFPRSPRILTATILCRKRCNPNPAAAADAKSLQSCLTLCDPIDGSPPGSPSPGILQARTVEWVAIAFYPNPEGNTKQLLLWRSPLFFLMHYFHQMHWLMYLCNLPVLKIKFLCFKLIEIMVFLLNQLQLRLSSTSISFPYVRNRQ